MPTNHGRVFFCCPVKDIRKPKGTPDNGCTMFTWSDDIIHSLCSMARQMQMHEISQITAIDPGLVSAIYPQGVPFLFPEEQHYPCQDFASRAPGPMDDPTGGP